MRYRKAGRAFCSIAITLGASLLAVQHGTAREALPATRRAEPLVTVTCVPDGGQVPDAAIDRQGIVHLVYGKDTNAFYAQSRDGGRTFNAPVRLNSPTQSVTVGGERGPKLALGRSGAIQVVWQGDYRKGGGVWTARSLDGGKTFAAARNILDTTTGIDEPTITADAQGNVVALWLDGRRGEDAESPVSSPLFMARSTDNGATFSPNQALQADFSGRGCSCCMLWARIVGPELFVAFRSGYHNFRDIHMLHGPKTGNAFRAALVNPDNWKLTSCPMSGPRFSVWSYSHGPASNIAVAWMSRDHVYWALSEDGGNTFSHRIAAGPGNYPMVISNGKSIDERFLFLWTREGQAHWETYGRAPEGISSPLQTGSAENVTGRPFVLARPGGGFVLLL